MSLAWRIRLLLAAFFALLCVNAGLALLNVIERDAAQSDARAIGLARDAANLLLGRVSEQENGTRSYVITGDPAFRSAAGQGRIAALQLVELLEGLLEGDAELEPPVSAVQASLQRWQTHTENEVEAADAGNLEASANLVGRGQALSNVLRRDINDLRVALRNRRDAVDLRLDETREQLLQVLFASFAAGAALLLAAGWLLRRWITLPLAKVSAAVRAVADGSLATTVPEAGPVDVALLGGDVERMRRRIIEELDTAVRAGEALAQHGPAVVSLHAALAPVRAELPDTVSVAARLLPAAGQLAGDWYDLIPLERGKVALAVVDVSGHGAEAGVLALRAKQLLLASVRDGRSPGGTLEWVAANLGETGEMFLTAAIVELNPALQRCRYANAGHPPLLLATPDGVLELPPTGPLLGPLAQGWATERRSLQRGALLVAYTDGLVEARGLTGREFGTERLISLVTKHRAEGPERIVTACIDAVRSTTGGRLEDDLTIVALCLT